jgi:ABC-type spermidine/putrescine transport system permease subunit I
MAGVGQAVREPGELDPADAPALRSKRRWEGFLFLAPLLLFVLVVFDLPLATSILWSLSDPSSGSLTLSNYADFLAAGSYARIIWRTFLIAGEVTLATALVGYPLAYWISRLHPREQAIALGVVIMTFWVSILVRTYAWIVVLGNGGILNRWLQGAGLAERPIEFIYNETGVAIGMTNVLLPFLVLPLFASMRRIDGRLLQVAETLGASRLEIFWRVFFPLALPALAASMVLVFILSLGFYITPAILGGGRVPMIANMMDLLINKFARWEMAAVNSVVLLVATLSFFALYQWLREKAR